VITRVDRPARSVRVLQDIVQELRQRGVTLNETEQPIDTCTVFGKPVLNTLGLFAEFEINLRREHQLEGIAVATASGAINAASDQSIRPASAGYDYMA
jgi:DNA invertase Pin-like site-specific DNA recombinase